MANKMQDIASIPDNVTAQYISDLRTAEPETVPVPMVVEKSRKFLFRTRPGTTDILRLYIPGPDNKQIHDEKYGKSWEKTYKRIYGEAGLQKFEDLRERAGGNNVVFTRLGPGKGCYYQTDDAILAAYIRSRIGTGKDTVPGLYEDYSTSMIRSQYTDKLFPNSDEGRRMLGEHDLAIELKAVEARTARETTP